jgi:hypothetical protein
LIDSNKSEPAPSIVLVDFSEKTTTNLDTVRVPIELTNTGSVPAFEIKITYDVVVETNNGFIKNSRGDTLYDLSSLPVNSFFTNRLTFKKFANVVGAFVIFRYSYSGEKKKYNYKEIRFF